MSIEDAQHEILVRATSAMPEPLAGMVYAAALVFTDHVLRVVG